MPGRLSTQSAAPAARLPRKSSALSLNSNRTATRITIPENIAIEPSNDTTLRQVITTAFSDAQRSLLSHRKLVVSLRKAQEACCSEPRLGNQSTGNGLADFTEAEFNEEFARCILRILPVRKSESAADRVVRFVGSFLRHASDKDVEQLPSTDGDEDEGLPETSTTRLTVLIFSVLLPVLESKDKNVRYRAAQTVSHIVHCLESIDDEYYHLVRIALLRRSRDKEAMVRVQAVLGLVRLAGNDDEGEEQDGAESDDDAEDAAGLLAKLIEALQHDPSADVRRTLLLNLPLTETTLPYLLERARDLDAATRRALYSRLLPALGDFRHLSLSMREKLLRWGFRDRDLQVQKATARLFRERWIDDCAGVQRGEGQTQTVHASPNADALFELLERIDVVNAGVEHGVGLEAMKEFWQGRPDYIHALTFDADFWDSLTSEKAFVVRSLMDFICDDASGQLDAAISEKMPEVTRLAHYLSKYATSLITRLQRAEELGHDDQEEETVELEFVVEQLLHLAQRLDYADEVGRRQMFGLLREMLAMPTLPEETTRLVVELLRPLCGSVNASAAEREFCGVVLEAVAEVHDTITGDIDTSITSGADAAEESFHSARSEQTAESTTAENSAAGKGRKKDQLLLDTADLDEEKAIQEIMINMKCLHIAQCMLQNIQGRLKDNVHLVTMLNNLVVPAVRSHEAPIRERGLECLGLCCLLNKSLADENLSLFLHCFSKGHAALQTTALQILCDILTAHPSILQADAPAGSAGKDQSTESVELSAVQKAILKAFSRGVKAASTPDVQTTAITALGKLLLVQAIPMANEGHCVGGSITEASEALLRQLIAAFYEPTTRDNPAARQVLSYFLPVFARSRHENAMALARLSPSVMRALANLREEEDMDIATEEDLAAHEGSVGLSAVGAMLVDWTDPRKLVALQGNSPSQLESTTSPPPDDGDVKDVRTINSDVHLTLAQGLLERVRSHSASKDERKAMMLMLGKLHITAACDAERQQRVLSLANDTFESRIAPDATARNSLSKLILALEKVTPVTDGSNQSILASGQPSVTTASSGGSRRMSRLTTGGSVSNHDRSSNGTVQSNDIDGNRNLSKDATNIGGTNDISSNRVSNGSRQSSSSSNDQTTLTNTQVKPSMTAAEPLNTTRQRPAETSQLASSEQSLTVAEESVAEDTVMEDLLADEDSMDLD